MTIPLTAELCYLLCLPLHSTSPGQAEPAAAPKDAPYFFNLDIEFASAGNRTLEVEGTPVAVHAQVLDGLVWLAECRYRLEDCLSESALARKQAIQTALRERLRREAADTGPLSEQYTILLLRQVEPTPDAFVDAHAAALARLMRSLHKPVGEPEIGEILGSRARYSQHDLTVVDWEGAIVIAEEGDFQSDIELLKIGNYQLLRYRMLDQAIERNLQILRRAMRQPRGRPGWLPSQRKRLSQIVEQRLSLLLDFEKTDQSLLLIGDWYSSRLYRLIVDQFYLNEWKAAVSAKLDSLAAINETVSQHLALSWGRVLEFVQLAGWLFLLVGYFVLFFADQR